MAGLSLDLKDAITVGIAAYGAILSTYNLAQGVRRERRRLTVKMSTGMYTYGPELGPAMLCIEVVNAGHRPLLVNPPSLRLPDKRTLALMGADGIADFPKELGDGAAGVIRSRYRDIAAALSSAGYRTQVELTPICSISTGQTFAGRPWTVDVQEWLRM
jgi:hypothetical protein